jgi:hypothetical protein
VVSDAGLEPATSAVWRQRDGLPMLRYACSEGYSRLSLMRASFRSEAPVDLATFLIASLLSGSRLRLESLEVRHSPLEAPCHTGLVGDSVIACLSVQMVPNDMGVGTYL